ncbi:MAG: T9SS type A sorting domain-containing protein [Bacteroidetes bacterium]|nr:T9SS type A sorting domain-containing protein [Bacteroidota bacterium]
MKKILLLVLFAFAIKTKAQITMEHKYDSASTYGVFNTSTNTAPSSQLMLIKFELSGERYVKINRTGKMISIYDINHSLVKTISLSGFPGCNGPYATILYFSEQLFNTDAQIEFMYIYGDCAGGVHTQIYKEDGTIIFSADSMAPLITLNIQLQQYPIYNTSQGTKMILSDQSTTKGDAIVYSLPGTLSTGIQEGNAALMQAQGLGNLYPNPSNGAVTLQYELPKGEKEGEIILYNTQGAEVKRYKVDDTFTDLLLDNTQLPAGVYYYQLQTSKGSVGTKKMVVVK